MVIFTFALTCLSFHFCFELHVVLLNLYLQSHKICTLNALTFIFSFGTHIFGDKTLKFPAHLFKLMMNG